MSKRNEKFHFYNALPRLGLMEISEEDSTLVEIVSRAKQGVGKFINNYENGLSVCVT
jgi:3-hydroxyacyl-CoA dehydrogenase